ncbi:MAG: glycosyltransferase family 4 protein [Alphaproteobacteria bacterium]|nr:glycosyltransferase family 4 protein [Alphaproteobacteria bacterium]MDE1969581.1 glycosyltransferase family 4 protein [Alphaproteobacteria bacterium]
MGTNATVTGAIVLAAGFGSTILTAFTRDWLRRRAILDQPGERSSHATPVPRGAGLAVVLVLVIAWLGLTAWLPLPPDTVVIALLAFALALLSFVDDLRGLPVVVRLAAHFIAAVVALAFFPHDALVFQGLLPLPLDRTAAALLWVWFVNLYNFMDGIDGITGVETACIGLGVAIVSYAGGRDLAVPALVAVAVVLGFLRLNWQPASVFLGDAGSVPLGYVMGWLLLVLARHGLWAPALILPLYYLADATVTLARRARRGEALWRAHRDHFYQRALHDNDHAAVALLVLAGDVGLAVLALLALARPLIAVCLAAILTAAMLVLFARRGAAD